MSVLKTDGAHKIKGKFFKKDSGLYRNLVVQEYDFAEIRKEQVIHADNPASNIYFQRLHSDSELDWVAQKSAAVFPELLAAQERAPVIFPRDFTQDWIEEKKKAKNRAAAVPKESDDFDLALQEEDAMLAREEKERRERALQAQLALAKKRGESGETASELKETSEVASSSAEAGFLAADGLLPSAGETATLEELGKKAGQLTGAMLEGPLSKAGTRAAAEAASVVAAAAAGQESGFQPLQPREGKRDSESSPSSAPQAEEPAAEPRVVRASAAGGEEASAEQALHAQAAQAQKQGYEQGFKSGEEKAYLETKQASEAILTALDQGLKELAEMQKTILKKSQHNFYEVISALGEAILDKSFKLNPALFKQVVDQAVTKVIKDDTYTIRVHPSLLETLHSMELKGVDAHWQADAAVSPGQFVIESQDARLQSDFKEIIQSLLKEVDLSLFTEAQTAQDNTEEENSEKKKDFDPENKS